MVRSRDSGRIALDLPAVAGFLVRLAALRALGLMLIYYFVFLVLTMEYVPFGELRGEALQLAMKSRMTAIARSGASGTTAWPQPAKRSKRTRSAGSAAAISA